MVFFATVVTILQFYRLPTMRLFDRTPYFTTETYLCLESCTRDYQPADICSHPCNVIYTFNGDTALLRRKEGAILQQTRSSAALKLRTIKPCLNPEGKEQSISGVVIKDVLIVR